MSQFKKLERDLLLRAGARRDEIKWKHAMRLMGLVLVWKETIEHQCLRTK